MNVTLGWIMIASLVLAGADVGLGQDTVFETTSPYHHIRVADHGRMRILHFNHTTQSQISLDDPLQGHFEYTEYFHMPWLWNDQIKRVLMIEPLKGSKAHVEQLLEDSPTTADLVRNLQP